MVFYFAVFFVAVEVEFGFSFGSTSMLNLLSSLFHRKLIFCSLPCFQSNKATCFLPFSFRRFFIWVSILLCTFIHSWNFCTILLLLFFNRFCCTLMFCIVEVILICYALTSPEDESLQHLISVIPASTLLCGYISLSTFFRNVDLHLLVLISDRSEKRRCAHSSWSVLWHKNVEWVTD